MKASSEYAAQAGDMLQEKVPVVLEGLSNESKRDRECRTKRFFLLSPAGKDFAAKAVEMGQEYGKEALEKTEKYAEQVYEAGKEKAEGIIKDTKKKFDL